MDPAIWPRYCRPAHDLRPVYRDIETALRSLNVEYDMLTGRDAPLDIWIRDWGFVEDRYFTYAPSYAANLYGSDSIARARATLDRRIGGSRNTARLVLDGGNLVHNGRVAFVTEKVFDDNRELSRATIEQAILALGLERVVFIPVEPEDEVGHADGILRFVSDCVLLVNDYADTAFSDYRHQLFACIRAAKIEAELTPFPWFASDEKLDGVYSAVGVYVNFIQTARGIVFPTFGTIEDERVGQLFEDLKVGIVRGVRATPLARFGGGLNCASLTH